MGISSPGRLQSSWYQEGQKEEGIEPTQRSGAVSAAEAGKFRIPGISGRRPNGCYRSRPRVDKPGLHRMPAQEERAGGSRFWRRRRLRLHKVPGQSWPGPVGPGRVDTLAPGNWVFVRLNSRYTVARTNLEPPSPPRIGAETGVFLFRPTFLDSLLDSLLDYGNLLSYNRPQPTPPPNSKEGIPFKR